ncbi:hypothetical protein F383_27917 [Gossypium arboreum]|uniref:Uncharacterized protein n=1 Tax=Gossypium arboreum TaxID=29729 RepID=A0A0B0P240_GOSAR|nr:hypothetical protein F383_27917 [Gossypium arboreum]
MLFSIYVKTFDVVQLVLEEFCQSIGEFF